MSRALFITFEGGEGAGKTTLIEKIAKRLAEEGRPFLKTREPGGTKLGDQLREIVLHHKGGAISPYAELSLFLASRAQHVFEVIQPALKSGKIVLCDRFNDSSVAYQGFARGLGMEKVQEVCTFLSEGLVPDLTFYLDIPVSAGLRRTKNRSGHDRIELETIEFHESIRTAYQKLYREHPNRIHLLNAENPPHVVFEEAMRVLSKTASI
jgi:dTMP kinase